MTIVAIVVMVVIYIKQSLCRAIIATALQYKILFTLDISDADDSFGVSIDIANRVISNQWPYMTTGPTFLAVIGSQAMRDCVVEAAALQLYCRQLGIR